MVDMWEHWVPRRKPGGEIIQKAGIRRDGFSIVDGVAVHPEGGWIVFWQACAGSGVAAHRYKAETAVWDDRPVLPALLAAGSEYWIVGWRKLVGSRKWQPLILRFAAESRKTDFPFVGLVSIAKQEEAVNGEPVPVRYTGA